MLEQRKNILDDTRAAFELMKEELGNFNYKELTRNKKVSRILHNIERKKLQHEISPKQTTGSLWKRAETAQPHKLTYTDQTRQPTSSNTQKSADVSSQPSANICNRSLETGLSRRVKSR
ncbi:hypothetical protein FHG87_006584 [Trinorchestia longiramus]|nr:hypothetical protein FHG87_006584 [Trinorchestia longiramus]